MNKAIFLILAMVLTGCMSVSESINGVSKPSDLVPNPWPEPSPQSATVPDVPK